MRLELGTPVRCTDDTFGELADVVIDPDRQASDTPVELAERRGGVGDLAPLHSGRGEPARKAESLVYYRWAIPTV
jgi:hypothetical protein